MQQTTNVGEVVEKREPSALLVGMQTGAATVENIMKFPLKTKNRAAFWPANSIAAIIHKESWDTHSKEPIYPNVHSSIIYNIQVLETT